MSPSEPSVEQLALDRLHAVARRRAPHPSGGVERGASGVPPATGAEVPVEWPDGPPTGAVAAPVGGWPTPDPDPADARGTANEPPAARTGGRRPRHRTTGGNRDDAGPSAGSDVPWLPLPPARDVADVAVRDRSEALAAAAAGYTEAYGHPLDHPGEEPPPGGRRWWLSTRHAVVAGVAVAVLATGVVVRASAAMPEPPVGMGPVGQVAAAQQGDAGSTGPDSGVGAGGGTTGGAVPGTATGAPGPGEGAAGAGADPPAAGGAAPPAAPGVVVHVVGQVAAPGVLTLPAGSRVSDAVAAAGGPGPGADLAAVNLARALVDGEQIHVPAVGEEPLPASPAAPGVGAGPGGAAGGAGPPTAAAPVPLNTADLATLDALPGIGPVLAQRILDWRSDNGPFRSVDELGEVSGIGDALLGRLRPLVRV